MNPDGTSPRVAEGSAHDVATYPSMAGADGPPGGEVYQQAPIHHLLDFVEQACSDSPP